VHPKHTHHKLTIAATWLYQHILIICFFCQSSQHLPPPFQGFLPTSLPNGFAERVSNPQDDFRLGGCTLNFLDLQNFIISDLVLTNEGVWSISERLANFAGPTPWYAYSAAKRLVPRQSGSTCRADAFVELKVRILITLFPVAFLSALSQLCLSRLTTCPQ
jgi:hypothetical protein